MIQAGTINRTERTASAVIYPPQVGCCCFLEREDGECIRTSTVTKWYHDTARKTWCIYTLNSIYRIKEKKQ